MEGWIDVSIPLKTGMVHWPGDPEVRIDRVLSIDRGDRCNVSSVAIGSHTGTHMDPPFHYLAAGTTLDAMPLDTAIGPARVIEIEDAEAVRPEELARHEIAAGERILLKTRNSSRCWETDDFLEDFVYISRAGAQYLAEQLSDWSAWITSRSAGTGRMETRSTMRCSRPASGSSRV